MPREGLTSELRSCPSEVRIAFLKESIRANTCGSSQIVAGFAGALPVTPGAGDAAPGVTGDGVPIDNVEVGRRINVGVAGACVAGEAHAVNTAANRVTLVKQAKSVLVFISLSSLIAYLNLDHGAALWDYYIPC